LRLAARQTLTIATPFDRSRSVVTVLIR